MFIAVICAVFIFGYSTVSCTANSTTEDTAEVTAEDTAEANAHDDETDSSPEGRDITKTIIIIDNKTHEIEIGSTNNGQFTRTEVPTMVTECDFNNYIPEGLDARDLQMKIFRKSKKHQCDCTIITFWGYEYTICVPPGGCPH